MSHDPRPGSEFFEANLAYWEAAVPAHRSSAFYGIDEWIAAGAPPRPREHALLGDVAGLDLVHLQCHFGKDSLAWANVGARVTGVDFSPAAIDQARTLAERLGLTSQASFVLGDAYDVPELLPPSSADVVYVSLGALMWLPSIDRWASLVAHLLRPGGRLFLHEVHPIGLILDRVQDGWMLRGSYFESDDPMIDTSEGSYTDGAESVGIHTTYSWNHSLSEVISALLRHGLVVTHLEEHSWTSFPQFPEMRGENEHFDTPPDWVPMPLSYTLMANRST
ncbi:MAG: methyltransferase domain-containing protein [Actinomycetota bacterium]|nr:methyltransferase domain-containing protein [Actinomycetota bacterium]